MLKSAKLVLATAAVVFAAVESNAQTATTVDVSASVIAPVAVCIIDLSNSQDLAFPPYTQNQDTPLTKNNSLFIECSTGGSVTISMANGPARVMSSTTTSDDLSYVINRPNGGGWGTGGNAYTQTLAVGSNEIVMAGVVAEDQDTLTGTDYVDTVNVTIAF